MIKKERAPNGNQTPSLVLQIGENCQIPSLENEPKTIGLPDGTKNIEWSKVSKLPNHCRTHLSDREQSMRVEIILKTLRDVLGTNADTQIQSG